MAHKDPEVRREYHRRWREAKRAKAGRKPCACGCGEMVLDHATYAKGHRPKLPQNHVPRRVAEAPLVECACGCGQLLPNRNKHGNRQRYVYGHSANKRWPTEEPPLTLHEMTDKSRKARVLKWTRKIAVLRHYSGGEPACACCGETNPVFLAIDHAEGNGNEHRRKLGIPGGYGFYLWLIREGFPEGFRVLCHNCNMAISILGYCPHNPPE
jgi:hypothetical protein